MKPVPRRGSYQMATIRVEFAVSRHEVVDILAMHADLESLDLSTEHLSRTKLDEAVRTAFYTRGAELGMYLIDALADLDDESELRAWAEDEVSRLYPDWAR